MTISRYITVADAARRLGLSTQRIYQLIKAGRIEAIRVGEGTRRVWLIDPVILYFPPRVTDKR